MADMRGQLLAKVNGEWLPAPMVTALQEAAAPVEPTGGTITEAGGYRTHTFAGNGTFTAPSGVSDVEILVVAGGGAGAWFRCGGGGGGGVLTGSGITLPPGDTLVVVGAGGAAPTESGGVGQDGEDSSFGAYSAVGGGRGGGYSSNYAGFDGGSGGGGGNNDGITAYLGGSPTSGQGNAGGDGAARGVGGWGAGGGGGGAGAAGQDAYADGTNQYPGAGGDGVATDMVPGGYVGGGGGGHGIGTGTPVEGVAALGGAGGGGDGSTTVGVAGMANTGGGGGAGDDGGGIGGSGVVAIRYPWTPATPLAGSLMGGAMWRESAAASFQVSAAGLLAGDLLVVFVSATAAATAPTGWTWLGTQSGSGTYGTVLTAFARRLTEDRGVGFTAPEKFTFATSRVAWTAVAFRDSTVGETDSTGTGSDATGLASATVTATDGSTILTAWGTCGSAAGNGELTVPSPLIDADGESQNGAVEAYRDATAAYEIGVAAGTTTARTATAAGPSSMASFTVEIVPA